MKQNFRFLKGFILRNVKPPEMGAVSKFWPREMKLAKELFAKYPDQKFFESILIDFGKGKDGKPIQVNSLAYFKMKAGDDLFKRKLAEFNFVPQNTKTDTLEISDGKFGETLYNSKPQKFLNDFLK